MLFNHGRNRSQDKKSNLSIVETSNKMDLKYGSKLRFTFTQKKYSEHHFITIIIEQLFTLINIKFKTLKQMIFLNEINQLYL